MSTASPIDSEIECSQCVQLQANFWLPVLAACLWRDMGEEDLLTAFRYGEGVKPVAPVAGDRDSPRLARTSRDVPGDGAAQTPGKRPSHTRVGDYVLSVLQVELLELVPTQNILEFTTSHQQLPQTQVESSHVLERVTALRLLPLGRCLQCLNSLGGDSTARARTRRSLMDLERMSNMFRFVMVPSLDSESKSLHAGSTVINARDYGDLCDLVAHTA